MDASPEFKRLLKEHESIKADRRQVDTVWREAARLCLPAHDGFGRETPPDGPDPLLYDDTGEEANRLHAAVLNYLLTPDGQEWHGLEPADPDLEDDSAALAWCQNATKALFKVRGRSAFAAQIHEVYLSVGAFGPGPLLLEDLPGVGVRYEACRASDVWFSEGPNGEKDRVHRAYQLHARLLPVYFSELPERLAKLAANEPDRKVDLVHVVEPNRERKPGRLDGGGMPFTSWHVAPDAQAILRRAGYRTMPYAVGRYLVAPGEVYGRSPAWAVLPTLQTLNTKARNDLIEANRRAEPPLLAHDDDLQDPPTLAPNAINYGWLDADGRPRVRPMEFGADRRAGDQLGEDYRARVDRAFLVSLFLMLANNPQMTATEVMERSAEKGIVLAPIMGRLQGELLRPMIRRELDIASAAGLVPPPPPALVATGGVKVQYTSPLARLVAADESRGIMETANAAGMLAQLDPSVLDRFNFGAAIEVIAKGNRVPAKILRSDGEVRAIQAQRAEKQEQAELLQAAPVAADLAGKLGSLPR